MSMSCPKCKKPMSEGRQYRGVVTFKCDLKYTDDSLAGCNNIIKIESKFKVGEEVIIINDNVFFGKHMTRHLGEVFDVDEISFNQGVIKYSLTNEDNGIAWVYESQLELFDESKVINGEYRSGK